MIEDAWDQSLVRKLVYKPLAELEEGPEAGMCEARSDMWLVVHPDKGVIFFRLNSHVRGLGALQGNRLVHFTERRRDDSYPGALVVHTRRIFIPIDLHDYR